MEQNKETKTKVQTESKKKPAAKRKRKVNQTEKLSNAESYRIRITNFGKIFIRKENTPRWFVVDKSDILYLSRDSNYVDIFLKSLQKKITIVSSLVKLMAKLNDPNFAKLNRGFVINIHEMTWIEGRTVGYGEKGEVKATPAAIRNLKVFKMG